jgi:ATP-dependent Zn protease
MKNKGAGKIIAFYLIFFAIIIIIANSVYSGNTKHEELEYSEVVQMFQKEEVKRYYIDNANKLYLSKNIPENEDKDKVDLSTYEYVHNLRDIEQFRDDLGELILQQTEKGILARYNYQAPDVIPWWMAHLPYLIVIIALIVIFWLFISRTSKNGSGGGMGLGLSGAKRLSDEFTIVSAPGAGTTVTIAKWKPF